MNTDHTGKDAMPSARPSRRVHRLGDSALLVDCPDLEDVLGLHAAVAEAPYPGQTEIVPAATTLLLRFSPAPPLEQAREIAKDLARRPATTNAADHAREIRIPVVYDGADLHDVATILECSAEEVIARHTGAQWTAAFSGFAPGFAYLAQRTRDPRHRLTVPRRDSPRTRVPAGAVALAGDFSAVYPSDSPGGWQLIGRTDAPVWDLDHEPPALIVPGSPVRFTPSRPSVELQESSREADPAGPESAKSPKATEATETTESTETSLPPALRLDAPGLSTLFQDAGRPGHADWGVSPSGWADPAAACLANELVGNPRDATTLENTAGAFAVTALRDTVLAVTGGRAALTITTPDREPTPERAPASEREPASGGETRRAPLDRPFALLAGERRTAGPASRGLRLYLAARGGFLAPTTLGSSATDTLSRLGPTPLPRGAELAVGEEPGDGVVPVGAPVPLPGDAVTEIRVTRGPRTDWFTDESVRGLARTVWRVTEESNRVGARLRVAPEGSAPNAPDPDAPASPLNRTAEATGRELPSEGLAPGSIQVPPSGEPIIFLADRPVTGGYPVIGVAHPADLRLIAQAAPGTLLRLRLDPRDELTTNPVTSQEEPHA